MAKHENCLFVCSHNRDCITIVQHYHLPAAVFYCILIAIITLRGKELSEFSSSNNEGKKMQYQKFKVEHLHYKAILTVYVDTTKHMTYSEILVVKMFVYFY